MICECGFNFATVPDNKKNNIYTWKTISKQLQRRNGMEFDFDVIVTCPKCRLSTRHWTYNINDIANILNN